MSTVSLLIAEDEAISRDFIKRVLANQGAPVSALYEASDGREALALYGERRPDLVFLDIRMPYLDGLQVAEKIQAAGRQTRVVIISAHDEFEYARSAFRCGVEDFLLKPVRPAEILRQVRLACEAKAGPAGGQESTHPLLRTVADYVEAHLNSSIDLEALASAACLSRSHLSRTFKKLAGRTIMEFVQERRLAEAGKLLAQSHLSITEIGELTGFASPAYFAACFRKYSGQSPSEFRKEKGCL